ncbi:MAG: hypothetical protein JW932_00190 [Deltaproteobacteria bacterium]|nr:hypothetical protein [Deltaproteobacteria bacterium]
MMSGLGIENAEAITLDSKNNVFHGPRGLFRIVVDNFDGQVIQSWHVEDKYGEKSENLGGVQTKSLDTIVGKVGLYMGGNVMSNVYSQPFDNLKWTNPEYVHELIRENQRLKSIVEKNK